MAKILGIDDVEHRLADARLHTRARPCEGIHARIHASAVREQAKRSSDSLSEAIITTT